jgi:prepilin-type N-terminal cleavage/methylation domain-containing protein
MNRLKKNGFTIVELLVVVAIIALLIAILLPAIGRARDAALVTQSLGNLRNMSAACVAYGADYNDRQYTAVPDETGMYGNYCVAACTALTAQQCLPQMILGWDSGGGLWGYWCRGTPPRCAGWPGSCGQNFVIYQACDFWGSCQARWLGSWRLTNCKAFNSYLNGRYYDKVFWAPKDTVTLSNVEQYFSQPVEFNFTGGAYAEPTYCWSPAAMWSPDVCDWQRRTGTGPAACIGPPPQQNTMPGAYKSPAAGMAAYPSLKWRMWEHQWLQNREGGETNPAFTTPTPWFYNQGYNSAPAVMCFDGHTQIVSIAGIQQDNDLAGAQGTPLYFTCGGGANAYFAVAAYDMLVTGQGACNAGVLTVNGILGRDFLRIGD